MTSRVTTNKGRSGRAASKARRKNRGLLMVLGVVGVAILALGAVFVANNGAGSAARSGGSGMYPYQVGSPGPGQAAPPIRLPSTTGGTFDLQALRGKTVLLYFQEGIMCQACWDQIRDIEAQLPQFKALGIDQVVSITSDELDLLRQKVADEKLSTAVLSDPDLAVSKTYTTNQYGMMGTSRNGHTFMVVGPDGTIRWRADYGGAPKYTMYVPVANLLADLRAGLQGAQ